MKKYCTLAVVSIILISCAVHKKQYYIFSRSVLQYGNSENVRSQKMTESIELNSAAAEESRITGSGQEKVDHLEPHANQENLQHPGPTVRKGGRIKKGPIAKANVEDSASEKLQPKESTGQRKNGDSLLYLATALIGLTVMGLFRLGSSAVTKITRWAKANPKKTQGLIAGMHVPLMGLGVMNGYNLDQMGYEVSNTALYGFGAATLVSFLSVPFTAKNNTISLPRQVNRQRLGFMGLLLSSLMMMTGFGNRIEQNYPNTRLANSVEAVDHSVFYASNTMKGNAINDRATHYAIQKVRAEKGAMSAGTAVVLIILLSILACAGICLIIGGFAIMTSGQPSGALLAILGGIALLWLSIRGINSVVKRRRETKATQ